jgi:hypothetical protein
VKQYEKTMMSGLLPRSGRNICVKTPAGRGKEVVCLWPFLTANRFDQNHIKLLTESEPTARLACRALSDIKG